MYTNDSTDINNERKYGYVGPTYIQNHKYIDPSIRVEFSSYPRFDIFVSHQLIKSKLLKERIYKLMKELVKVVQVDNPNIKQKVVRLDNNKRAITDENGNELYEEIPKNGLTKCIWKDGSATISYASKEDAFNPEAGLMTCVLKKVMGNKEFHDFMEFWTEKHVKYPCKYPEVTEALCKLEKVLKSDSIRSLENKGLSKVKFLLKKHVDCREDYIDDKEYKNKCREFIKCAKLYFENELKGKKLVVRNSKLITTKSPAFVYPPVYFSRSFWVAVEDVD